MWDKEYRAKWRWECDMVENLKYNGIVPGVEGYVNIKHWGNEELMDEIVELGGCTEFPQVEIDCFGTLFISHSTLLPCH